MTNKSLTMKLLFEFLFSLLFLLIVFFIYIVWERNRNPLEAIDLVDFQSQLIKDYTYFDSKLVGDRFYKEIELSSVLTDTIRAIISLPVNYTEKQFPVITILGGINIGRENLRFIHQPGENILVVYIYDYKIERWEKSSLIPEVRHIRKTVLKTPAQIVELQSWLLNRAWTDTNRVAILGYSFGALFLPAAQHLAWNKKIKTGPSILAYGGADFDILIERNLSTKPKWLRPSIACFASSLLHSVDPINHIPYMKGEFYLINGARDKQIPAESWQLVHDLTPQPKKIEILDEGHMHPRKEYLTEMLIEMSHKWLKDKGVLN